MFPISVPPLSEYSLSETGSPDPSSSLEKSKAQHVSPPVHGSAPGNADDKVLRHPKEIGDRLRQKGHQSMVQWYRICTKINDFCRFPSSALLECILQNCFDSKNMDANV